MELTIQMIMIFCGNQFFSQLIEYYLPLLWKGWAIGNLKLKAGFKNIELGLNMMKFNLMSFVSFGQQRSAEFSPSGRLVIMGQHLQVIDVSWSGLFGSPDQDTGLQLVNSVRASSKIRIFF